MEVEFGKFVPKGWGYEFWICNLPKYCGKILFFKKGKKCSLHYHNIKDETFYVQSGSLLLKYCQNGTELETKVLDAGDIFHVSPGMWHQMIGLKDTTMLEFSTHHEDEDSIRIEKGD